MKIVGYLAALSKYFSVGDGGWAFDGIEMTSVTENDDGQMVVNCMSTHLTSFAVLVDVSGSLSVSSYIIKQSNLDYLNPFGQFQKSKF